MRVSSKYWLLIAVVISLISCQGEEPYTEVADQSVFLHKSMKGLTDVIVHDIFSPPVASRIYAYPALAAYEINAAFDPRFNSLAGQLNGLESIPEPDADLQYSHALAAVHALLTTGKALIFSEKLLEAHQDSIYSSMLELGIPEAVYQRSLEYGEVVAAHILAWADKDNYKETRTFPKYAIPEDDALWKPTPPDYMEGIEPHWREIRTFVLDSSTQFVPKPPTEFSTDENSQFYEEVMEVYDAVASGDPETEEIARFWDCNPFVSHHRGHVMFATKKITPGGHWVGITGQASRQADLDFGQTAEAYARVTVALADAFISCWDEKYRSSLIRPETFINTYIDPDWLPTLQTPPFPEHTSGHSVISSAAGEVLTDLLGDNFAFVDSVELEYGLPVRAFDSFRDAYAEAAVSRLYGGIHYMPAIDYGVEQGKKVGQHVIENLQTSAE